MHTAIICCMLENEKMSDFNAVDLRVELLFDVIHLLQSAPCGWRAIVFFAIKREIVQSQRVTWVAFLSAKLKKQLKP